MDSFVYSDGMQSIISVLRTGEIKVVGEAFDIITKMVEF
jgi:hypothetical protein